MNLFVTAPRINPIDYLSQDEAAKVAAVRLTSSPGFWDDEIVQTLLRDHPYIPPQRIVVNFKRKDDTQGAALGFIGITGAPQISIPIVIKNRELFPLDVIIIRSKHETQDGAGMQQGSGDMTDDKVLPLNEETFSRALDVGDIGESTPEHMTRGVGYTEDGSNLRLPFRGRTVLASFVGASEKQKAELGKILSQNKEAVAGFLHHNTADVINSWFAAPDPKQLVQSKLASALVKRCIAVMPEGFPEERKTAEFLAAEVFVSDEQAKVAVSFNAIDLTSPISGEKRYLLFEDGSYCTAPEKVAVLKSDRSEDTLTGLVLQKTASGSLHRGSTVSFMLEDKFTVPAKIASICVNEQLRTVELDMLDGLARTYKVCLTPGIKTAMFDDKTGVWVLPIMTKVLELSNYAELQPLPIEKVASFFQKSLPDQLINKGGQFTLILNGDPFGPTQCTETKMAEVLHSWFENADMLLAAVKTSGMVRFTSNITEAVKTAAQQAIDFHAYPKIAREAIADAILPMDKAVKLAAAIGDPNGADSVLSAGFLNEDNLAEFVSLGDKFQETVGKLARLLLAIRMGFPGDESATVVAMKALQRVSDRLQSAVQEVNS